jgi:hypothetical protein
MSAYMDTPERLAEILGVTVRWIQQQTKSKVLHREQNGQYDIAKNVERYFRSKFVGKADLETEKALHEKAKRELAEIQLARIRGEMHDAKDVEKVLTGMLVNFRSRMLSMPQKMASQTVGLDTIAEIAGKLEEAVLEALQELSQYDPEMFEAEVKNVAEEDGGAIPQGIEDGSAAAEAQGEPVGGPVPEAQPRKRGGARTVEDKPRSVPKRNNGRRKRPGNRKGSGTGKQPGRKKRNLQQHPGVPDRPGPGADADDTADHRDGGGLQ